VWETPTTRFARSGNVHIAFQVVGDGPLDLIHGIYVNEMGPDERIHDAYSAATLARLVDVKNGYDPANFFRMNQNIHPTP